MSKREISDIGPAIEFVRYGRYNDAARYLVKYIRAHYNDFDAYHLLGFVEYERGKFDDALSAFKKAIALKPDRAEPYCNLANVMKRIGRLDEAINNYDKAIKMKGDFAFAYSNRGVVLQDLKRFDEALASHNRAVELDPGSAESYFNRGIVLQELKRYEEAVSSYDMALQLNPNFPEACCNRGMSLQYVRRLDEALANYDLAIKIRPDYAEAHKNKALMQLLRGEMDGGFQNYEWRKREKEPVGNRSVPGRLLTSIEGVEGKTIMVHWEQGLGDTIQFCRYVSLLCELGAKPLFAPQKQLIKLLKSSLDDRIEYVDVNDKSLLFDYHVPLMSLPLIFGTTLDSIPFNTPYLFADAAQIEKWRARLADSRLKVGICWKGGPYCKADADRSFSIRYFERLSKFSNVRLISLQKGEGEEQLNSLPNAMMVEAFGHDFDAGPDAFVDTAAVMKLLDLIITCDTSVAHLAGALGIPVWVALSFMPDWRWMLDRADSPWYPTMQLFRQKSNGDWKGVFDEIEAELTTAAPPRTLSP